MFLLLLDVAAADAADKLREDAEKNPDKRVSAPLDKPTAAWVLEPLRLAAASGAPKLVEPALGCLHKLVRTWIFHFCDGIIVRSLLELLNFTPRRRIYKMMKLALGFVFKVVRLKQKQLCLPKHMSTVQGTGCWVSLVLAAASQTL